MKDAEIPISSASIDAWFERGGWRLDRKLRKLASSVLSSLCVIEKSAGPAEIEAVLIWTTAFLLAARMRDTTETGLQTEAGRIGRDIGAEAVRFRRAAQVDKHEGRHHA